MICIIVDWAFFITQTIQMSPYKQIYLDILQKPNVEKVIEYLYSLDFKFVTYQYLKNLNLISNKQLEVLNTKLQYLIRYYDRPRTTDLTLIVGLDYFKRGNGITIYKNLDIKKQFTLEWAKPHGFNMKEKKKPERYPDRLGIEERKVWRKIDDKIKRDRPLHDGDLEFYLEYKPEIDEINGYNK